jgi:hypothetical protein
MTDRGLTGDGACTRDGDEIPLLGLGVWEVANGPETENAVHWALELAARTGQARSRTPRRRGS